MELLSILEKLADNAKELKDSTFRILEKIIENDAKKAEEIKKIVKVLWIIVGELFILILTNI